MEEWEFRWQFDKLVNYINHMKRLHEEINPPPFGRFKTPRMSDKHREHMEKVYERYVYTFMDEIAKTFPEYDVFKNGDRLNE